MTSKARVELTKELVDIARQKTSWELGNKTLYDLCAAHPGHEDAGQIIAKLWLIGRAYAAAIERRRKKTAFEGDDFYIKYIAPEIIKQRIDDWLAPLSRVRQATHADLDPILSAHARLTALFSQLTALNKRSLASKYLHFHFPHLFYIYDTRATEALTLLGIRRSGKRPQGDKADNTYRIFVEKCLILCDRIEEEHQLRLTPRELDNLLLEVSHRRTRKATAKPSKRSA